MSFFFFFDNFIILRKNIFDSRKKTKIKVILSTESNDKRIKTIIIDTIWPDAIENKKRREEKNEEKKTTKMNKCVAEYQIKHIRNNNYHMNYAIFVLFFG